MAGFDPPIEDAGEVVLVGRPVDIARVVVGDQPPGSPRIAVARISDRRWSRCPWPKYRGRRSCLSRSWPGGPGPEVTTRGRPRRGLPYVHGPFEGPS